MSKNNKLVMVCLFVLCILTVLPLMAGCAQTAPSPKPTPAPAPAPKAEPIVLKALSYMQTNTEFSQWMVKFCDAVTKKSDGALTLKFMGGPEVTPGANQAQAVLNGVVDMSMHDMEELVPSAGIWDLTRLTSAEEKASGFNAFMQKQYNAKGFQYLGRLSLKDGFYLMTKFMVEKPEDFAEKKMRSSPPVLSFYKALKIAGTSIPMAEQYTALERGVVQGKAGKLATTIDEKSYEVLSYWVDHSFYDGGGESICMNLKKWEALPANLQKLMMDALVAWENEGITYFGGKIQEYKKVLTTNKMQPITFKPEDAKRYLDLAYDSEWAANEAKLGKDFVTEAKALQVKK